MSANLLYTFTERELSTRYAGSALGFLWTLIGPILMLVVYSLVFGRIFNAESQSLGTTSYIHYVALALWPWLIFGDGITRGLSSIQANAALIKKVAFPLTIPVGASVGSTIIVHLVGYVAVLGALAATGHTTRISGIFGAFIILCALAALTLGVALALAALQTILRDVEQAIQPALLMLYFLTPVLYPASIIPEPYRQWLDWNPLALIMGRIRAHLLSAPGIGASDLYALCVGLLVLLAGWFVFTRLSPHFEDFL
jgi:lipopolysaccharide transport system permease protein